MLELRHFYKVYFQFSVMTVLVVLVRMILNNYNKDIATFFLFVPFLGTVAVYMCNAIFLGIFEMFDRDTRN